LPTLDFEGVVFSGKGEGKKFVSLPWVNCQIKEKIGFAPYNGTLNLRLNKQGKENKKRLQKKGGIMIQPQEGYCPGISFKAQIDALDCAVIIPLVPNYPKDVLEIIAPIYLRSYLCLIDGNTIKVAVTF
jgi:riboflavin kinase, archaea type